MPPRQTRPSTITHLRFAERQRTDDDGGIIFGPIFAGSEWVRRVRLSAALRRVLAHSCRLNMLLSSAVLRHFMYVEVDLDHPYHHLEARLPPVVDICQRQASF